MIGQRFIALPAHLSYGLAEAKHRIEQQLHTAAARAHQQIGAGHGALKTAAGGFSKPFNRHQKREARGDRQDGEQYRAATTPRGFCGPASAKFSCGHLQRARVLGA